MSEEEKLDLTKIKESRVAVVWILGGPGSGRGTQCEILQAANHYVHLSTGFLLRNEVLSGSKNGLKIFKLMEAGEFVPAEIVMHLLAKAMLSKIDDCKGFLIDGFPLDLEEATKFEREVVPVTRIVHLKLEPQIMMDRLIKRQNFDDLKPGAKEQRIKTYRDKTLPVLKKYSKKVIHVDADGTEDEVRVRFLEALLGETDHGGRPVCFEEGDFEKMIEACIRKA